MTWLHPLATVLTMTGVSTLEPPIPTPIRFAVIVGNNQSLNPERPDLAFADDDAVLYAELLDPWAEGITILTTLDDETQRRFPSVARRTLPPTKSNFEAHVAKTFEAIEAHRKKGREVDFWFVYVGHGSVDDDGWGYVDMQDERLTRRELYEEVLARSPATRTHIIIDACHAYSFVAGRGSDDSPNGRLEHFLSSHDLDAYPRVGVLLATTEDRETHEWSRIRSGIFSHQVRSALSGAGDINGDGRLEYSEVAAFVSSASANLDRVSKRFYTFAWSPPQERNAPLLVLKETDRIREVHLAGNLKGHMVLESESGVRWGEFHKAVTRALMLFIPKNIEFFLRDKERELLLSKGAGSVVVEKLPARNASWLSSRGAVDRAFEEHLFTTPFSEAYYRGYVAERPHLVPVEFIQTDPAIRERPNRLMLSVGYGVAASPLDARRLEHDLRFGAFKELGRYWSVGIGLDVNYASLPNTNRSWRFSLRPGAEFRWPFVAGVDGFAVADVGYSALFLRGPVNSADPSVFLVGVGGGARVELSDELHVSGSAIARMFVLSLNHREAARVRPEISLSLGWDL